MHSHSSGNRCNIGHVDRRCEEVRVRRRGTLLERTELVLLVLQVLIAQRLVLLLAILLRLMGATMPRIDPVSTAVTPRQEMNEELTVQGYRNAKRPCCNTGMGMVVPGYGFSRV